MKTRRSAWLSGFTLATVTAMAACSAPAKPSADLSRDLDAASSTSSALTLAPTSGSRDVVSAVERAPDAPRAAAPAKKQIAARTTPPPAVVQPVVAAPQAVTPKQAVAAAPTTVAPAPTTAEASRRPTPVQQAPRGGYKTEAEVFRDAPFPIQP